MKYVLLLMGKLDAPGCDQALMQEFSDFDAELEAAGVLAGGFALEDPDESTTSVTKESRDSDVVITTGPYTESNEFVGGTWIIDVPTFEEALAWAVKCPAALGGRVEIRLMLDV